MKSSSTNTATTTTAAAKPKSQNLVDFNSAPSKSSSTPASVDLLTGLSPAPDLMGTTTAAKPADKPLFDLDPGFVSSQQSAPVGQHSLIPDPQTAPPRDVKNSIMSLYSAPQPQVNSYTAQGHPVNAYYYQQQQQAAARMAQIAQQQTAQVNQVQQQMAQLRITRPPVAPVPIVHNNPTFPQNTGGFGNGGQTLNPHLW